MKPYDASYFNHDRCRPFLHTGGDKGVLLLHGFTGSVAHMRPLGDALADRGYTVMGVNLPGHATTEEDMAKTGLEQWISASQTALKRLRSRCDTVAVAGLSMGGDLSLILAEEKLTDACITLSTPMAVQNKLLYFSRVIAPFKPRISWAPSPERKKKLNAAFDYGYSGFPTRSAADLNRLIRMARKDLHSITCPTLTVQSLGDETIWLGSADCILSGIASAKKEKLVLKDDPHVCTLSDDLPEIVNAIDEFLS
ncbi:MAG: alpha/beta fold hydrolase [Eubacteriales bacterium]|nr:alpha/beta fold hydrolase [Eubacteriales bacterium]